MRVEVDMSGRVEEKTRPTAVALANSQEYSLRISARDKRAVVNHLSRNRPHLSRSTLHVLIFATLLFLLLKECIVTLDLVIIDPEYVGYEAIIKDRVLTLLRKHGIEARKDQLTFRSEEHTSELQSP